MNRVDSQQPSLWDGIAERYSDTPDSGESEIASDMTTLLADLGVGSNSTLLEAGCGSGHISSVLASRGYSTTLLDFSKVALSKAEKLYQKKGLNGRFIHSDLFEMSGKSIETHDIVWNSGVLEHFDGWQIINAMEQMRIIAKRFVIIMVPNPASPMYVNFRKRAMQNGSWQWGLEILRESMNNLARFSGLDIVEERFTGASHLRYFEELTSEEKLGEIPDEQKYIKILIAKPAQTKLDSESRINILLEGFREDSRYLRNTYYTDVSTLQDRQKILDGVVEDSNGIINQLNADLDGNSIQVKNLEKYIEEQRGQITKLQGNIREQGELIAKLQGNVSEQKDHIKGLNKDMASRDETISLLTESLEYEKQRLYSMMNTKAWRLSKLYEKKFQGSKTGKIIEGIVDYALREDIKENKEDIVPVADSDVTPDSDVKPGSAVKPDSDVKPDREKYRAQIRSILDRNDYKGIIVYPPTIDWNIPLLQRPQHMASSLAKNGWLYFYCTTNSYDDVRGFNEISERLYITDKFDELAEELDSFVLFVHSAHPTLTIREIKRLERKAVTVYDYLDEIHPDVSGLRPGDVLERHRYMIRNSDVVMVTARDLLTDVEKLRKKDVYLIPNAVDYSHFHIEQKIDKMPGEIKKIRKSGIILGYFGALAKWFDYTLIKQIASENPEWSIVLIGWDYDGTIKNSGIDKIKNIHYLGVKEYSILPEYAVWFDVCMIPFILSSVTHAASPIKLFEYMALGKPTVATPIKEVTRYDTPLVASGAEEFASCVREALELKDSPEYLKKVDAEAKRNTWKRRFDDLDGILEPLYSKKS